MKGKHQFDSYDEFIKAMVESKEQYEKRYLTMSFKEKIEVLARIQKKVDFMRGLRVMP